MRICMCKLVLICLYVKNNHLYILGYKLVNDIEVFFPHLNNSVCLVEYATVYFCNPWGSLLNYKLMNHFI